MIKGLRTCAVCGRDFALMAEDHYVARDTEKKGVIPAISGQTEATLWDAFDCPHCGCQNVMQERKTAVIEEDGCPCDFGICDECDHAGVTEDTDHDGCAGCKYVDLDGTDEPCRSCKSNYTDNYTKKEEKDE